MLSQSSQSRPTLSSATVDRRAASQPPVPVAAPDIAGCGVDADPSPSNVDDDGGCASASAAAGLKVAGRTSASAQA
jgi:hypothetical protein